MGNEPLKKPIEIDEEGMQNLVGLFKLLLEIDRRVNPHLYEDPDRDTSSDGVVPTPKKPLY